MATNEITFMYVAYNYTLKTNSNMVKSVFYIIGCAITVLLKTQESRALVQKLTAIKGGSYEFVHILSVVTKKVSSHTVRGSCMMISLYCQRKESSALVQKFRWYIMVPCMEECKYRSTSMQFDLITNIKNTVKFLCGL